MVKHLSAMLETRVWSLGQEDPLEKEMATHSSTLAWKIPWTEESVRLQSIRSQRVRHDWVTTLLYHTWLLFCWAMFLLCLLSGEFFLIINGYWILSKAFSASIEIIIRLLSFNLLMWCITLIDLQILKNPCIPGINPTWSWCMIFLICCWILFTGIFKKDFCIYVHQWYWPVVFLFVASLSGFGIRMMVAS